MKKIIVSALLLTSSAISPVFADSSTAYYYFGQKCLSNIHDNSIPSMQFYCNDQGKCITATANQKIALQSHELSACMHKTKLATFMVKTISAYTLSANGFNQDAVSGS